MIIFFNFMCILFFPRTFLQRCARHRSGRRLGPVGSAPARISARDGSSPAGRAGAIQSPPRAVEHTAHWAQAAETGRKERDGAGRVRKRCLFTQEYGESSSPNGVVVSRRVWMSQGRGHSDSRCCARGAAQKSGRRRSSWSSWASL